MHSTAEELYKWKAQGVQSGSLTWPQGCALREIPMCCGSPRLRIFPFLQRRVTPGRASDQANRGVLCNFEGYGVRWCPESSWYKTVCGSNLLQNSDMHSRKVPKCFERPENKSALGRWQRSCSVARGVDLTRDILVNMWVKSPLRYLLLFAIQSCYKKFSFFRDHPVCSDS